MTGATTKADVRLHVTRELPSGAAGETILPSCLDVYEVGSAGRHCDLEHRPVTFSSTKTYGHSVGFSCAFRQWRAESHCRFLHGYALAVSIEFQASELYERGWVVDFGALKSFKAWLERVFDHKTLIAADDPLLPQFRELHRAEAINLVVVPAVGCERFAEMVLERAEAWLTEHGLTPRCWVAVVEVREHEGNSGRARPMRS